VARGVAPAPARLYFAPAPLACALALRSWVWLLAIFHIKQQAPSLQLCTEVQFQSQNEKTELRGVFFRSVLSRVLGLLLGLVLCSLFKRRRPEKLLSWFIRSRRFQ
jgi:hypothetical protein